MRGVVGPGSSSVRAVASLTSTEPDASVASMSTPQVDATCGASEARPRGGRGDWLRSAQAQSLGGPHTGACDTATLLRLLPATPERDEPVTTNGEGSQLLVGSASRGVARRDTKDRDCVPVSRREAGHATSCYSRSRRRSLGSVSLHSS